MLKLRYSPTSPYVRKVVMLIHEIGLGDRVERIRTDPWSAEETLGSQNPLNKVPTLITEDGMALFDSPVICEYLDSLHDGPKMFPAAGPARWVALRLLALGDGICDAAVLRRLEQMRPDAQRSADWIARQQRAVMRGCDFLEAHVDELAGPLTVGGLAVLAALGYLDFRFGDEDWRPGRPRLAAWFAEASQRDSFRQTQPPA